MPSAEESQEQHPSSSDTGDAAGGIIFGFIGSLLAGFVLTAGILHLFIRDPLHLYAEIRSEKLAMLDEWRGRASSAVFGSSHVDNGVDPRAFDAVLHGTTGESTTLNLGISGGCQTEQEAVARAFIDSLPDAAPNSPPRFVLLEISASANFTEEHLMHPRAINIYDLHTVKLAFEFAGRDRIGWRRAIGRSGFALVAGLLHYTNVGMLSSKIFSPPLNPALIATETGEDRRGLTPNQVAPRDSREFAANQKILAGGRAAQSKAGEILEGHMSVLRDLAEAARRKNVQFVYFVAPRLDNLEEFPEYPESIQGPLGPVLILNEGLPSVHPELYSAVMWHDPSHLTELGAGLFSRLLGDDLRNKLHLTAANEVTGGEVAVR